MLFRVYKAYIVKYAKYEIYVNDENDAKYAKQPSSVL